MLFAAASTSFSKARWTVVVDVQSTTIRDSPGTSSSSSASSLAPMSLAAEDIPVTLPPERDRLATSPWPT